MAPVAKKKIETEQEDEALKAQTDNTEKETVEEDTEAQDTIKAHPTDVSRSDVLAMAMATLAEMPKEDLTKWWWDTLSLSQNLGRGVPDGTSERNKNSVNMKPSGASAANLTTPLASIQAVKEDLQDILKDQPNLPEEFVKKALTLFESAVNARVIKEVTAAKEEQEKLLTEQIDSLTDQIDEYLDYAAKEFFEENQVAIESALKIEMYESFVDGLRDLFAEHHIILPEERTDVVDAMSEQIDDLTTELNARTDQLIAAQDALDAERATRVFKDASKGLTATDVEQFKKLSETVEFSGDETDLAEKLKIIRDSHFNQKKAARGTLTESLQDEGKVVTVTLNEDSNTGETVQEVDPEVAPFVKYMSRMEARKRL